LCCRLLLEGCASLRTSLQQLGSNLLWQQGSPEALVGRLVALAAAAGTTRLALHHYTQPGAEALEVECKVAAAFAAAAAAHGKSLAALLLLLLLLASAAFVLSQAGAS
jgi:deoxyribodipyrimidine photolyase